MKKLVIVESPAKAKTIEKILGKNYTVLASVGHVRDLPKSSMGVDIENDFEPKYITPRGENKADKIKELKKYAKKSDIVYLATDPDREGEAIAWHLKYVLRKECDNFQRVEFNAITPSVIKTAIKNPREINQDMVDAQQARRIIDRIMGYSLSPILWNKVSRKLSAGRVQSVVNMLLCDKEKEINNFVAKEYWSINGRFKKDDVIFDAILISDKNAKTIEITDEKMANYILDDIKSPFIVDKVVKKIKKRNPYLPFTTSTLQQEASNKLGFATKKTMLIAQQLYEGIKISSGIVGLITYMRTDSTRINEDARKMALDYIEKDFGKEYKSENTVVKKVDAKKIQDAHEAIRPIDVFNTPKSVEIYLTKDQYKLYELIWKRFIASNMKNAEYEMTSVDISTDKYIFKANASVIKFNGFLEVYDYADKEISMLPELEKGDVLKKTSMKANQHFTKPPSRYTEASLVKTMEELGIGRPSTYASTISTVLSRGYAKKEKKQLHSTELGNIVNDIMINYFSKEINVDFTAKLEEQLDEIANNGIYYKNVIRNFYDYFKDDIEKANEEIQKIEFVEKAPNGEICEKCDIEMVIKRGRYGKFLACVNYPECDNTMPILYKIGVKCPFCKVGDVIERKTKKLKSFYGCSEFPKCNYLNWNKPFNKQCPKCGEILYEKITAKTSNLICQKENCNYKEIFEIGENKSS